MGDFNSSSSFLKPFQTLVKVFPTFKNALLECILDNFEYFLDLFKSIRDVREFIFGKEHKIAN